METTPEQSQQAPRNESMIARHLLIGGRVQGVSYRYTMANQALIIGIKGWCRNLPDGQVEALIIGTAQQVAAMLDWCAQGPPHAEVDQMLTQDRPIAEALANAAPEFEIRH